MKIGIIGPESTGKSTLAQQLAHLTGGVYVAEYAREYVEQLRTPYTFADVEHIARRQIEQLSNEYSEPYIFFDTELILTKVWFEDKYGRCPDFVLSALENNPIDFYLLCLHDLPFVDDPVRENGTRRNELFDWYKAEIEKSCRPYSIVRGSNNSRTRCAMDALLRATAKYAH